MISADLSHSSTRALDGAYEDLIRKQLTILGHDTRVNGLAETPSRVARFHKEHFQHHEDPIAMAATHLKPFDAPALKSFVSVSCSFSAFSMARV